MGRLGGPDPDMPLIDVVLYPILQDATSIRLSMVLGNIPPIRRLMTDAKILDSKGK